MERSDLARIMAFTDGVMAVAITLLVLNLEVPDVPDAELAGSLEDLLPSFGAYLLSFALVGRFWIIHHRQFETLRRFDGRLMALNLVFLSLIALLPFATDLMEEYAEVPEALAVFGATVGLASLTHSEMSAHALRRGFVADEHRDHLAGARPIGIWFAVLFFLSVPLAFLSTGLAQAMWVAVIFARYPVRLAAGRGSDTSP